MQVGVFRIEVRHLAQARDGFLQSPLRAQLHGFLDQRLERHSRLYSLFRSERRTLRRPRVQIQRLARARRYQEGLLCASTAIHVDVVLDRTYVLNEGFTLGVGLSGGHVIEEESATSAPRVDANLGQFASAALLGAKRGNRNGRKSTQAERSNRRTPWLSEGQDGSIVTRWRGGCGRA